MINSLKLMRIRDSFIRMMPIFGRKIADEGVFKHQLKY